VIEQGEQAPDFELPDQDGNPVKLSDLRGQPVVVYFYPKADTRGPKATKMARDLPNSTATLLV
jgi:peroxiredoxin Q/BCP